MAAVTQNSVVDNVDGSIRERFFNINIATSGDTLVTGLKTVLSASFNDVAITKAAPGTGANTGTLTLTTTGAVTNALLRVAGL